MGDFRLPPATSKVSSLIQGNKAQPAAVQSQSPVAPSRPGDQVVSKALPAGQASQTIAFVEAAPAEADLKWAQDLEQKVTQGYKPTQAESQTYQRIADQLEASQPVPRVKPLDLPVSEQECQWAASLEAKVQQGQKPSAQELASYQNIAYRLLKADQAPVPHPGVSREELNWALNLQKRVSETGYKPTTREMDIFTDIYQRQNAPLPQNQVSEAEIEWARQLAQHVTQGYKPSPEEQTRYTQIYQASQSADSESVSKEEISWSVGLSHQVEQGYKPSQQEMDRYGDISRRLALQDPASIRPEAQVVSQHELDWAGQLQQQIQAGVPATDQEQKRYASIYKRYSH